MSWRGHYLPWPKPVDGGATYEKVTLSDGNLAVAIFGGIETAAEADGVATDDSEQPDSSAADGPQACLLYTSPSPRDKRQSRMPSSA